MLRRRGCGCGCGGLVLVLAALLGLGYFLMYRPASQFVAAWKTPQSAAQVPPPSGNVNAALTKAELEKFVRVRRAERDSLGTSFTAVQQVWQSIQQGQVPTVWQSVGVLGQLGGSVGQARSAQASALTKQQLSRERYNVIRNEVNRALGLPDINFSQVAADLQAGKLPQLSTTVSSANPATTALIAPFRRELSATAALGLLGL